MRVCGCCAVLGDGFGLGGIFSNNNYYQTHSMLFHARHGAALTSKTCALICISQSWQFQAIIARCNHFDKGVVCVLVLVYWYVYTFVAHV